MIKRYDELVKGDVIMFYGAKLELTAVYHVNDCVVRFDTKPFDKSAVEVLGQFYSHGTYGGDGCLTVEVIEND